MVFLFNVQERAQAKGLFLTKEGQATPLAMSISSTAVSNGQTSASAKTFEPGAQAQQAYAAEDKGRLLTPADKKRIRAAIEAATSVSSKELTCQRIYKSDSRNRSKKSKDSREVYKMVLFRMKRNWQSSEAKIQLRM